MIIKVIFPKTGRTVEKTYSKINVREYRRAN